MNLLSRLFSKPKPSARAELQKRLDALERGRCQPGEALFASVLAPAERFRPAFLATSPDKEEKYLSDGVLFELAAYLLCRVDSYLFQRHPNLRERYVPFLFRETAALFREPLGVTDDYFADLMNDRMVVYGKLISERKDAKDFHDTIVAAIEDTISNGSPQTRICDRPPCFGSALDIFTFNNALLHWELNYIPIVHKALDEAAQISNAQ